MRIASCESSGIRDFDNWCGLGQANVAILGIRRPVGHILEWDTKEPINLGGITTGLEVAVFR
jgi:hypothetical protein